MHKLCAQQTANSLSKKHRFFDNLSSGSLLCLRLLRQPRDIAHAIEHHARPVGEVIQCGARGHAAEHEHGGHAALHTGDNIGGNTGDYTGDNTGDNAGDTGGGDAGGGDTGGGDTGGDTGGGDAGYTEE